MRWYAAAAERKADKQPSLYWQENSHLILPLIRQLQNKCSTNSSLLLENMLLPCYSLSLFLSPSKTLFCVKHLHGQPWKRKHVKNLFSLFLCHNTKCHQTMNSSFPTPLFIKTSHGNRRKPCDVRMVTTTFTRFPCPLFKDVAFLFFCMLLFSSASTYFNCNYK